MRHAYLLPLLCASAIAGLGIAGSHIFHTRGYYGPYVCPACSLRTPAPEAATAAYLKRIDGSSHLGGDFSPMRGDIFVICNASFCVDYTRTDSFIFEGSNPRRQENHREGGGGGGGSGSGGGGGGSIGGGSSRGGSVIVRPPVKDNRPPTHDD